MHADYKKIKAFPTILLVRHFVGLPLAQPGPDHSTLADFHAYLTAHAPQAFFADVLTFRACSHNSRSKRAPATHTALSRAEVRRTAATAAAHQPRRCLFVFDRINGSHPARQACYVQRFPIHSDLCLAHPSFSTGR
jgi:hypothetical protein